MQAEKIKPELKFVSSWDDDNELNYKLAELLQKYNLPAIFYLTNKASEEMVKNLAGEFAIGGHSVSHNHEMRRFHQSVIWSEIVDNKTYLEKIIDRQITQFCYPRGRYNDKVIEQLKKAGFISARTTKILSVSPEEHDPYEQPSTIHVYNRAEYDGVDWFDMAMQWVKHASDKDGVFHIWGHSWEVEKFSQWEKLEKFFKYVTENYTIILEGETK